MYVPKISIDQMRKNARLFLKAVEAYCAKKTDAFSGTILPEQRTNDLAQLKIATNTHKVLNTLRNHLRQNFRQYNLIKVSDIINNYYIIISIESTDEAQKFIEQYNDTSNDSEVTTPKASPAGVQEMTNEEVFSSFKQLINDLGGRSGNDENHFDSIKFLTDRKGPNGEPMCAIYHNKRDKQTERTLELLLALSIEPEWKVGNNTLYITLTPNQNYKDLYNPDHKTFFPLKEVLKKEILGDAYNEPGKQQSVIAKPVAQVPIVNEPAKELVGVNTHQVHHRKEPGAGNGNGLHSKITLGAEVQTLDDQPSSQMKMAKMAFEMLTGPEKLAMVRATYEVLNGTDKVAFITEYGKALITDETEVERRINERLDAEKLLWEKDYSKKFESDLRSKMADEIHDDVNMNAEARLRPTLKAELRSIVMQDVKAENLKDMRKILTAILKKDYVIIAQDKPFKMTVQTGSDNKARMVFENTVTAEDLLSALPK